VKVRTIAFATFGGFLRNKVIILFCSLFLCVVLLMMFPLLGFKAVTNASNIENMQGMVLNEITIVMSMVSGFGSLLAAWAAADSLAGEIKSGTILAVMARPLRRWEFLAGKYLGVLMLMVIYAFALVGVASLLAWLGGQRFQTSLWTLVAYPFVRYAIWAAIAMLLATVLHPIFVIAVVAVLATLIPMVPFVTALSRFPNWLRLAVHLILPLTDVLSEQRFLTITRAALKPFPWTSHLTALAYGLDYALVCFVLAVVVFQYRNLSRD
jgi:ABC-type transport system involved in multi-copper enzyme maturation permease subunit